MTEDRIRDVAFVIRCSAAATLAFVLAQVVGLPHPVWATMTSVIVCQQRLGDTRRATWGRFAGTLLGVVIAVLVGSGALWTGGGTAAKIAVSVAIAAILARRYPFINVCMWTCPIVFLTATPALPLWQVGAYRGAEVLLGGLVGAVLHEVSEIILRRIVLAPKAT